MRAQELTNALKKEEGFIKKLQSDLVSRCNKAQKENLLISSWHNNAPEKQGYLNWVENQLDQEKNLLGVPYILEDSICTVSYPTTCGSDMLSAYRSPFDAWAVSLLNMRGAFLCGKASMPEFGLALDANDFVKHGGAGAVASGAVSFALVSDTTGEARQSGAYKNLIALKPTYGAISRRGLIGAAPSLEHLAVLTKNADDLKALMEALTVEDSMDVTSSSSSWCEMQTNDHKDLPLSIAIPDSWLKDSCLQKDIKDLFLKNLDGLAKLGFRIKEVPSTYFSKGAAVGSIIASVEAYSTLANFDGVRFGLREEGEHLQEMYNKSRSKGFKTRLKEFLAFGALMSSGDNFNKYYLQAQKARTAIKNEMASYLKEFDCILTPTMSYTPGGQGINCPGNEWLNLPASSYTIAGNLSGMPSISLPVKNGNLPMGLHFTGKYGDDQLLVKLADFLEKSNEIYKGQ